jgi:hypothetical protein
LFCHIFLVYYSAQGENILSSNLQVNVGKNAIAKTAIAKTAIANTDIALRRLSQQRLGPERCAGPGEVVGWLGAVQAQDYLGAKWSLGMRMRDAADEAVEQAFNAGAILRTHVMRPTWHFVTPQDIRWLQELTAPRVNAANASYYRQLDLDEGLLARSNDAIARALAGGNALTRLEIEAALAQAGILAKGLRLIFILHRAEMDGVVCSGPRRGKQFTYMLLDERAPHARSLPRDEALAELTRRYFTGHGPATLRDFAWWSGLTMADGKAGIEMSGAQLTHAELDGQTYWFAASAPQAVKDPETAFLLPTYDEFLISYAAFDEARNGGRVFSENDRFVSTIALGGQVVGSWRRSLKKGVVRVELAPFDPLTRGQQDAVHAAARRYAGFLGLSLELG